MCKHFLEFCYRKLIILGTKCSILFTALPHHLKFRLGTSGWFVVIIILHWLCSFHCFFPSLICCFLLLFKQIPFKLLASSNPHPRCGFVDLCTQADECDCSGHSSPINLSDKDTPLAFNLCWSINISLPVRACACLYPCVCVGFVSVSGEKNNVARLPSHYHLISIWLSRFLSMCTRALMRVRVWTFALDQLFLFFYALTCTHPGIYMACPLFCHLSLSLPRSLSLLLPLSLSQLVWAHHHSQSHNLCLCIAHLFVLIYMQIWVKHSEMMFQCTSASAEM